jgi:hypothetical protein
MSPLYVRCIDRTVFEIDRKTLDAKECSSYDAHCYTDPLPDVEYIGYGEWVRLRNQQWDEQERTYYRDRLKTTFWN